MDQYFIRKCINARKLDFQAISLVNAFKMKLLRRLFLLYKNFIIQEIFLSSRINRRITKGGRTVEIIFKEITKDNWEECIDLKVHEDQRRFIASNLYSIAQVQFLHKFEAMAIYVDDTMVGFTLFGLDEDDNNYWIYRIMTDEKYQGKGYGPKALQEIIHCLSVKADCKEIVLGYHPENIGAERMYLKAGFQASGIAPWGEKLVRFKLEN